MTHITLPSPASAHARPLALPRRRRRPALFILAAVAVLLPAITSDYWLGAILVPFLILALAGLGLNLLTGLAGQVSLGSGAFMAVGAFATYVLAHHGGVGQFPLALLGGAAAAGLAGLLFGLPSVRISGFYLMVSSLAAQFFWEWLFLKVGWFHGYSSSGTISLPALTVGPIDLTSAAGRYWLVLAVVAVLTWVAANLRRSRVGRDWAAIRDMDTAARVIGIAVYPRKLLAFAVSGFYLGVAGALWAFAHLGAAGVQSFGIARSFQVLFIIIIGGMGSIAGNFLGAAFISLLPLAMDVTAQTLLGGHIGEGLLQNLQKGVFGLLIIGFLIREPDGLARLCLRLWRRLLSWPLRF